MKTKTFLAGLALGVLALAGPSGGLAADPAPAAARATAAQAAQILIFLTS